MMLRIAGEDAEVTTGAMLLCIKDFIMDMDPTEIAFTKRVIYLVSDVETGNSGIIELIDNEGSYHWMNSEDIVYHFRWIGSVHMDAIKEMCDDN